MMKWNRLLHNLLADNTITKELECHISTNPRYTSFENTYNEVDSDSDTIIFKVLERYKVSIRVDRNFNVYATIEEDNRIILSCPVTLYDEHIYDRLYSIPTIQNDLAPELLQEIGVIYKWLVLSYTATMEQDNL